MSREDAVLIDLVTRALALNHVCYPITKLKKALGTAIATRMRTRIGKYIWQTGTGSVDNFPLKAAEQVLPDRLVTSPPGSSTKTWEAATMQDVVEMTSSLIAESDFYSAGCTRGLMTDSERVIRVVATLIPTVKITHVERSGMEMLRFTFQYVLADEHG